MPTPHIPTRRALLATAIAAPIVLSEWFGPATRSFAGSTVAVGIAMSGTDLAFESATQRNADLDAIAASGATWVRVTAAATQYTWSNASTYAWAPLDAVVTAARSRNLKVLVALSQLPAYAPGSPSASTGPTTDAQRSAFVAFATAAATRYAGKVSAWEIWPQANTVDAWTNPNAWDYTALLKAVYPAIKAADSSATVVTGGPNGRSSSADLEPSAFISSIYMAGGKAYFDAVGAYGFTTPQYNSLGMLDQVPRLRQIMSDNGDSAKQLWLTSTGTAGASESVQASNTTATLKLVAATDGMGPAFFATLRDTASNNGLGLIRTDGTTKPAYSALVNYLSPAATTLAASTTAATATATATSTATATATTASSTTVGTSLGISVPATDLLWKSTADRNAALDLIVNAGVGWLRLDVYLDQLTWVSQSQVDWPTLDTTVAAARSRNLKILGVLGTLPQYARPSGSTNIYGPTTDAQRTVFSQFAAQAAKRYAGSIDFWEIWNEPNLDQYWSPTPSASDYTALLSATYAAIKSAAPNATVISGGSGGKGSAADIEPTQWMRQLLSAGAGSYLDGMAIHAYTAPQNGNIGEFLNLPTYRSIMDGSGASSKQLWITEAGTQVGLTAAATDQVAADDVPKIITAWQNTHDHGPMMFYTLNDTSDPGFGFRLSSGSLRPSYAALQTAAAQAG